jgi:8-oxo-dGTP pyrophosphatase MutT (NUDIX family)
MSKPVFGNRPNLPYTCIGSDGEKVIWNSRSLAVCVMVVCTLPDGKRYVLIEQRGQGAPDFKGYFCLVCGYLDWDETLVQAALRETWEEAGLDIMAMADAGRYPIYEQPIWVDSSPSANRQNISVRFKFELVEDVLPTLTSENSEPDEIEKLLWMPLSHEQLAQYQFCFGHDEVIKTHLSPD